MQGQSVRLAVLDSVVRDVETSGADMETVGAVMKPIAMMRLLTARWHTQLVHRGCLCASSLTATSLMHGICSQLYWKSSE